MTSPALEPAAPGGDAFVDALLGLDQLCGWIGPAIDAAASSEPRATAVGDGDDAGDDLLDAVLGVASLRTMLALVLAALGGEPAEVADEPAAGWSRELLR